MSLEGSIFMVRVAEQAAVALMAQLFIFQRWQEPGQKISFFEGRGVKPSHWRRASNRVVENCL